MIYKTIHKIVQLCIGLQTIVTTLVASDLRTHHLIIIFEACCYYTTLSIYTLLAALAKGV